MIASLLHSLSAVAVILILTACGYFCSALGWITPDVKRFLSHYLMRIAVPVMCVYSLRSNLTLELLRSSWVLLLITLIMQFALYIPAWLIGRRMGLEPKRNSVFTIMCAVSNAMFIGYSMCLELFGEPCVPYVMIYYLVNSAFAQLVGVTGIQRAGGHGGRSAGEAVMSFFKTPPVIGTLLGILLILFDWTPPALLMSCARYINNTVTPLALLTAGHIIHEIGLKRLRITRLLGLVMGFRFLLAPALCLLLCALFAVTGLARSVLVVQSSMPVLTQSVVAAAEYGGDEQLAAQGVALSTLACFVVIPVLMLLL